MLMVYMMKRPIDASDDTIVITSFYVLHFTNLKKSVKIKTKNNS